MPLNQLCTYSGNKQSSFLRSPPFILASIHTEDVYDVKLKQPMERCDSRTSTLSFSRDICRICHCEEDVDMPLIAPCFCAGSLRFVHQSCLQQWIKSSDTKSCELCKFDFIMHSKVKPFRKWERLDMTGLERRKILCSVAFHAIAITCVVWSLYVLIQRTSQEVRNGELEWPFWTKLIVVAIGFTGSIVFMYVQCKMYVHLFRRWRAFNRVIYVQNAPEKVPLSESEKFNPNKESTKLPVDHSSEVEKPFLGVAVIPSTATGVSLSTSTNSTTSTGAMCLCTTSSPPGAIWADDLAPPPLTTLSYFNSGVSNLQRGGSIVETEKLISNLEKLGKPKRKISLKTSSLPKRSQLNDSEFSSGNVEPNVIHTPNRNSFRNSSDENSDTSDLETLHLETS